MIHGAIVSSKKLSKTMTSLNEGKCHKHTKKRVGCDSHMFIDKVETVKWWPFSLVRVMIDKCDDAIEKDNASPSKTCIEAKIRYKQDGGNK